MARGQGCGERGFGAVSGADSELGEVRYGYIYIGRYICMFNVHIDRLPGPLATMISPPSSVTPFPLAPSHPLPHHPKAYTEPNVEFA